MVFAQFGSPLRELLAYLLQHLEAGVELHTVALAVVKGNGFDALVTTQSERQAGWGILATGPESPPARWRR